MLTDVPSILHVAEQFEPGGFDPIGLVDDDEIW